jgi:O-antigen/teichoic acid export membrane protein
LLVIAAYVFRDYVISQVKVDSDFYLIGLPLIFLMAAYHFYRGCLYGLNLVDRYIKFEIISTILFFIALAASAYAGRWKLLLPFLLYYGLFSFLVMVSLRAYFQPRSDGFEGSKDIGMYGIIALIGTMASLSRAYIANIFTGIYLSPEQVGYYSAAVSITSILLYSPTIMGRVLLPTMSSSYGERDDGAIQKLLDVTTLWLSLASLFLGFIFIMLSEDILVILFKPAFSEATLSLQMLILGLCLSTIIVPSVSALSGTKFVKIPNAAGVAGLFVSLALWPLLIPKFGINGTAIGYIVGSACTSIIILYYATKYYSLSLNRTYLAIFESTIIFAIANLPSIVLERPSNWINAAVFAILFVLRFKGDIFEIYRKFRFKI